MRTVVTAEDKTKAGLQSAQNSLAGFARKAAEFAAGFATYDVAKQAISAVGGFLRDAAQAAMDAQTQMSLYNTTMANAGNNPEQIAALVQQAESIERVGGVSKDVVLAVQSVSAEFSHQSDLIQKITPAIVDYIAVQSGGHATVEQARTITLGFNKALQGQFEILSRGGFLNSITEAQKKTLEFGTEAERAAALVEILNENYKNANEALGDTAEGKIRKLTNAYHDMQEQIGNALLPSLDLFLPAITNSTNAAGDAIKQNDRWARSIYSFMSGVKAAIYVIEGLIKGIIAIGAAFVGIVAVEVAFVADVIKGFDKVKEAGRSMASALVSLFTGDFSGALDKFKNGLNIAKSIDLSTTKATFGTMKNLVSNVASESADAFKKAGAAMAEGVEQKGFKPIQAASGKTKDIVTNDAANAAAKASEAYKKAFGKIGDLAETTQGKIADLVDSYGQKTADNLEKHIDKIQDLNEKLQDTQADFDSSQIQNEGDYNARKLDLFMGHQDKLKDLQEQSMDLRGKLSEEQDQYERNRIMQQVDEIRKQITKEQSIIDENADLAQKSAQYRNTSDLERLKASYEEKKAADKAAFEVKMASIRSEIEQENAQYEQQTAKLREDTGKRFEDILSEYRKGYQKIIEETKAKAKEIAALQAQAKLDMDALVATATTSLGIVAGTNKNVGTSQAKGTGAGAPQFNFTFTGTVTDKETLVKTIVDAVNRANAVASAAKSW